MNIAVITPNSCVFGVFVVGLIQYEMLYLLNFLLHSLANIFLGLAIFFMYGSSVIIYEEGIYRCINISLLKGSV